MIAYRFTPTRGAAFADLIQGTWLEIDNIAATAGAVGSAAHGIVVDSRPPPGTSAWIPSSYGGVARIPLAQLPNGAMDRAIDGSSFSFCAAPGLSPSGVALDANGDLIVSMSAPSALVHFTISAQGDCAAPALGVAPLPNTLCPSGDSCLLKGDNAKDPGATAQSRFTSDDLINFCEPSGTWSYVFKGCLYGSTSWRTLSADFTTGTNSSVTLKARTGATSTPDNSWGAWSPLSVGNRFPPIDLATTLPGNGNHADYVQVEADLTTSNPDQTPSLDAIYIAYECQH